MTVSNELPEEGIGRREGGGVYTYIPTRIKRDLVKFSVDWDLKH